MVHAGYARYRKPLLQGGVQLHEFNRKNSGQRTSPTRGSGSSSASLHAKSFVFDRKQVFIGSLNVDPRSVDHNTEVGIVIDSPQIAEGMAGWFDRHVADVAFQVTIRDGELLWQQIKDGKVHQTFDHDPHTSRWMRFKIGLLGLLPIESQL